MKKKKTITKILSIVLSLVMIITGLPLVGVDLVTTTNAKTISEYEAGDIIEFGSYPQSEVTNTELISKLNSLDKKWVSYEYYSGYFGGYYATNGSYNYMKYADVTYNGIKYRAVEFSEYRPYDTYGENEETYQDDNGYDVDTVYWFKYEPLKWKILNPEEGFILCETIIDAQAFDNEVVSDIRGREEESEPDDGWSDTDFDDGWNDTTTEDTGFEGDIDWVIYEGGDWRDSSLRTWLNKDFYNLAFNDIEKEKIQLSEIETKTEGGGFDFDEGESYVTSEDNIFLLSTSEVSNLNYNINCTSVGTDYAKCQGLYVYNNPENENHGNSNWYLRFNTHDGVFGALTAYYVDSTGTVLDWDDWGDWTYSTTYIQGVRPALKLNPDASFAVIRYADGYNFETDRYNYNNWQLDFPVSLNAYKQHFGPVKGELLYNMNGDSFCYGMAATTAVFLKYPEAFRFHYGPYTISNLFGVSIYDRNGLFNLTAYDYIAYGYLYQFDIDVQKEEKANENDITGLYDAVNQYVNGTGDPVIINFYNSDGTERINGHTVVAIGLLEDDGEICILTNDSSASDTIQKIKINPETYEWEYVVYDDTGLWPDTIYHSYNSDSDIISYNLPADDLYNIGLSNASDNKEFYSLLNNLIISDKNITANCNLIEISPAKNGTDESTTSKKLYWVEEQVEEIEITALENDSAITVSDNNSSISVTMNANESANFVVDDENGSSVIIDSADEENVKISFATTNCLGEEIQVVVSASANNDKVSAILTNESISISGVSDGDVTLVKYDEIVETKLIDDSENKVEFDNKILASTHEYINGVCTSCGGTKPIPQAMSSQIRFSRNDDGSYAETFDVRTRAMISDEDFTELVGATNAEAVKNIEKVGFVYTVNGESFSATSAQAVAQGEKVAGYIDAPVSYIQDADGYYMFTCLVTDIPATDKDYTLSAYAYICVNGKWYFSEAPINADFNSLYETYYPIACEKYGW